MSQLLEEILSRDNMMRAYKRVVANKGASGVDGITTEEVKEYLIEHWEEIREQIRNRKYKPLPVRRVEIPKPNGGVRNLGIPSVVDRIIEQAIAQRLTPIVEPLFSDYSYGFRPKRRAQQAVIKLLEYLNDGYTYIVDIDLEKFFDNVPQDKLMYLVHRIIDDGDTESLIHKYLKAGVMVQGEYEATEKGTPQGGNLSPLLSNIMLNELDKESDERSNPVRRLYEPFTADELNKKMSQLLCHNSIETPVEIVFQSIEGLHKAIPNHPGDWYFTGHYPTPGGMRLINQAYIDWYESSGMGK